MKKLLLLPLLMGLSLGLFAQKYAYIDSEYILGNMPSYVEAQAELNRLSINWQNEIEAKFKEIDAMYRKYQQESVLLPEDAKIKRQEEIIAAETAAKELQKKPTGKSLFILDEPTTGLHVDDIKKLLVILNRIVDNGDTVVVIEHNLDVIKVADYIIDLGHDGGDNGGEVIGVGTPEEIAKISTSYTGEYLKKVLI